MEGVRLFPECFNPPLNLFLKTPHMRWQQTVQAKYIAFVIREGCSLIEKRKIKQVKSRKRNPACLVAC
jgi:hypothetical protein